MSPKKFHISTSFSQREREIVREALPKVSNLPEELNVYKPADLETAEEPFIVLTNNPTRDSRLKSYKAGALRYRIITNSEELADSLK